MFLRVSIIVTAIMVVAACGERPQSESSETTSQQSGTEEGLDAFVAFDAVIENLSRGYIEHLPESATYNGAPDDLAPDSHASLNDRSVDGEKARVSELEKLLAALKGTRPDALDVERRRIRASLIALLDGALAPTRVVNYGTSFGYYGMWFLPYAINQISGPTVDIPSLMEAQQSVKDEDEAEVYIARLARLPATLDGALDKVRHDAALGAIPPDFIVEKTKAVVDAFAAVPASESVLYVSFVDKLDQARIAGADQFASRALAIVGDEILPAYHRVSDYLAELKSTAPHEAGVWRLPNGEALYKAMIRHMTDSDLVAEDVHQIGLDEVIRITAEMDTILRANGYENGTVSARMAELGADERFVYPNTDEGKEAILASIQDQLASVRTVLPVWFGNLPMYDVQVRAIPVFSQESAPGGYYDKPSPDGSRPGIYWINLRDTAIWPSYAVPTLTYHEAIPGHHMQFAIAIAQDQPFIVSALWSNPATEGWALYAEALAAEMGLYADDPFDDLGRLQAEIHRAIRLVVDTGMHAMKWSREEAIDYMVANEGVELSEAVSEIERYVVWPGQALGYKIGMLKIQELRRNAEVVFGDSFDIREFHDRIIGVSSSALPVIEDEISAWISEADNDP